MDGASGGLAARTAPALVRLRALGPQMYILLLHAARTRV